MALHSLYCADVPLRNCSLTPQIFANFGIYWYFQQFWSLLTTFLLSC